MDDPIHTPTCERSVAWSTVNAGEAIPGVVTPLTWSFFGDPTERAMRLMFSDIGVLSRREAALPARAEERLWDIFFGRAAANLSTFRMIGDRTPGTSGDAMEEQIFGQVRPGVTSRRVHRRYPAIAARMPLAAARLIPRLRAAAEPVAPWWQAQVATGALSEPEAARRALGEAARRFEAVMRPHTLAAILCQGLYEQLRRAAEAADRPGLELSLITGYGQMAETEFVADLWAVSRDRLTMDEFLRRHGYHGPDEGELSAKVWRMRRDPLESLLRSYRDLDDDRDPRRVEGERAVERARAEAELFAALPPGRRGGARLVTRLAATFIPLRGVGKAAFLQCVDVARTAARSLGRDAAARCELADEEDVFMLTLKELLAPRLPAGASELAAHRRATHERYRRLDIPDLFEGVPEPFPIATATARPDGDAIAGTPVSPGVVHGVARVLLDPQSDESLQPGEILVCRATDPSWASTMMLAAALVIDIGGAISHGAIVARELGIPCVVGTRNAAARIATGDRLRVDGERGEVQIVARAGEEEPGRPEDLPDNDDGRAQAMDPQQFAVLRALRLKGRAGTSDLAAATGLREEVVQANVESLAGQGQVRELAGAYAMLPAAREQLDELLEAERGNVDAEAMTAIYEQFTPINHEFKALITAWQERDGEPNDHSDAAYDGQVLGRLPEIHERVAPLAERVGELAPRLRPYRQRLEHALARVKAGEHEWFLKPLIDSYHTVWFEFHEELIGLSGLSRLEEAAAGRAE